MRYISILALAAAALAACSREEVPLAPPTTLQTVVEAAAGAPTCRAVISVDWAHGWPIPAAEGTGRYKIFFYPVTGNPESGPKVHTPTGEALLDTAGGKPVSCAALTEEPRELPGPRWPRALNGADMKEFERLSAGLYGRTEAIAAIYFAKSADKALAEGYVSVFESMAEPSLLAHYYKLNPDFWEWLRRTSGRSIPKP